MLDIDNLLKSLQKKSQKYDNIKNQTNPKQGNPKLR